MFFGETLGREDRVFFKQHSVRVRRTGIVDPSLRYFLKWIALRRLRHQRLLYVDADTVFFRDPAILFSRYKKANFYAREELGTNPLRHSNAIGRERIKLQVDHRTLAQIARELSIRKLPIFNTGVMLFNQGMHKIVAKQWAVFDKIRKGFLAGGMLYPSSNPHILEEIVASLALGNIDNLRFRFLPRKACPWYMELKNGIVSDPGIVLHVWNSRYDSYLRESGKRSALKQLKTISAQ